jgi:hypothetical protein
MKVSPMKQILLNFTSIVFFSFVFNFLWESLHGFSLYQDHMIDSDQYVRMMVYMSYMDAVTILGIYLFLALMIKDILWLKEIHLQRFIVFFLLGLIVGAAAEYWAVYVTHQWQYNYRMPVVFGIGLSPLLQLSVTGLSAILFTARACRDR